MTKQEFINFINTLPDDMDVFISEDEDEDFKIYDFKVFTEPQSMDFYEEYFCL